MMAGVAQGLALMRGYVEMDGGLDGDKTGEALLNGLTESLGRGVDDPGKIAAETLALRSLRDIAHVTHLIMPMGLDFRQGIARWGSYVESALYLITACFLSFSRMP
jgi:hypothetical protein